MFLQRTAAPLLVCLLWLSGCQTIPRDALVLSPDTLERRQVQTRRFEASDETKLLAASAGVLQDLGFNIDESETRLGVIVASKDRSATSAVQATTAVLVGLLTGEATPFDKTQKIRVSLVARPALASDPTKPATAFLVRVTFQRIVWNTENDVTRIEAIDEPQIYQAFFERLSKSVFLEGQQI